MTLPRLLAGMESGPMDLGRHLEVHGGLPRRRREALIAELDRSGLRGHGGGAFPLGAKIAAARRARGTPTVVINGCEGEPLSRKDRTLMWYAPHLVLDGAAVLAVAVGAREVLIALDEHDPEIADALARARDSRPDLSRISVSIVPTPGGYVTGQETAIVGWINDGIAKPSSPRPRVTERGIERRPTLVSNVETAAHAALIARYGADWFRRLGTEDDPGTALVTLSGAVAEPGVYEVGHGQRLSSLLASARGTTQPVRAFLLGGYAGGWVDGGVGGELRLSRADLAPLRARLGAGIVHVLGASACPVAETARAARWMADQSAGQCGPCVHGLASIADALSDVMHGVDAVQLQRIGRWTELVSGRGACAHPDGAAAFVSSALRVFAAELRDHAHNGPCDACDGPESLELPELAGVS